MAAAESITQERRRSPYSPGIDPQKLRHLRFVANMLSQQELADKAGLSRAWIAKLECGRGRPSVQALRKLCDALSCKPGDLLPDQ